MNVSRRAITTFFQADIANRLLILAITLLGLQFAWPEIFRWWRRPRPGATGIDHNPWGSKTSNRCRVCSGDEWFRRLHYALRLQFLFQVLQPLPVRQHSSDEDRGRSTNFAGPSPIAWHSTISAFSPILEITFPAHTLLNRSPLDARPSRELSVRGLRTHPLRLPFQREPS